MPRSILMGFHSSQKLGEFEGSGGADGVDIPANGFSLWRG